MLRLRFDSLSVGATPIEVRPNGWRVYRGVASYGDVVLDYGPLDPGGARSEFVPASTALDPETVRLTEGIPFTVMHPGDLLNADAEDDVREHSEGTVLKAVADWKSSPPSLVVDVIVHTKSAQDAIESGRVRELSLGYSCDDEEAEGVHDGRAYQVVQRRRRPNHLSGVPRARSRTVDGRAARLDALALAPEVGVLARLDGKTAPTPPSLGSDQLSRLDALPLAPADHPASTAPVHEYGPGVAEWRGWSEDDGRTWVAFWPRSDDVGLLWTTRDPSGAVAGDPVGVRQAGTSPARLDSAGIASWLATVPRAFAGAPYAHLDAGAFMPPKNDETQDDTTETRADADPEVVAATTTEVVADPAVALAAFSPEDAEVLKTLSPEGLALLAKAMKQVEAEAAEGAVLEGADPAAAIAEAEDNDDAKPAPAAAAIGGAPDLDAMAKMLQDMQAQLDAMKGGKPKADAPAATVKPATTVTPAKPKTDAVAEQARLDAEKRKQDDAAFVAKIRKQVGSKARLDSAGDAAREALATIGHQTPEVLEVAKRAWNEHRLDDLAALSAAADRKRRDAHLDAQGATIQAVTAVEADYLAKQLAGFTVPKSAVSTG